MENGIIEKASGMLNDICIDVKNFRMSIPVQETDSDEVIGRALMYAKTLETELAEIAKGCNYVTCSGCHETIDGQETGNYPFDKMRGIVIGSGCHECKEKGYLLEDNSGREEFYNKEMGYKKFGVSSAYIVGQCEDCKEPATGHFRTDDSEFNLECVSCNAKYNYTVPEAVSHGTAWKIKIGDINKLKN